MSKTKWILVVDDEVEIVDSVTELLFLSFGKDKLKIVRAKDGLEATTKVNNQKFDCIITDLKMPKKEGDAFIASARQNLFNSDTPIIILSAFPDKKLAMNFRFVYFLKKPFSHDDLVSMVETQLKLGGGGVRVAADIVNRVLSASEKFLKAVFQECEFEIGSPFAKLAKENMECDHLVQLDFTEDGIFNSFSLVLKKDFLDLLKEARGMHESSLGDIALAFGQSLLKYAISSDRATKLKFSIRSFSDSESQNRLNGVQGICIPVNCNGSKFDILASSKKS